MKNKKLPLILICSSLVLLGCGPSSSIDESKTDSSESFIDSSLDSKEEASLAEELLSTFIEKGKANQGLIKVERIDLTTLDTLHIMDYSFFGEKAQLKTYTPEMKQMYQDSYNEELLDNGVLINGDQGAFTFTINKNKEIELSYPAGAASSLIDLSAYGPYLIANPSLYIEEMDHNHFSSSLNENNQYEASKYWLPIIGLSSSYISLVSSFSLYLDDNLENIICELTLKNEYDEDKETYKATISNLGNYPLKGEIEEYLENPKLIQIPTTFSEKASSFLKQYKLAGESLPFLEGADAQYYEMVEDNTLLIRNYGKNLIPAYRKKLLEIGFRQEIGSATYRLSKNASDEEDYLSATLVVELDSSNNNTSIYVTGSVVYRNLANANKELLAWNDNYLNVSYKLGLNYLALSEDSNIVSVYSMDITKMAKDSLASIGYDTALYFVWTSSINLVGKENALAWVNKNFSLYTNNGFTLEDKLSMEDNLYQYCFKAEAVHKTEIGLKFIFGQDDYGNYNGIITVQAIAGYYELVETIMNNNPYQ